ncbi:MAG: sugar ABC transporter substrate-binding protein [Saccharofermentanales bacterium]
MQTSDNDASIKVQVEEGWVPHYEAAVERVKKVYPKATIELMTVGSFDHLDTIDATNEDVADVFALPADRLHDLYKKEVLSALPAEQMAADLGGFADFNAGLGGNFKLNGEYMAFPYNIETLICFLNKANADAAGYQADQVFEVTEMTDGKIMLLPLFDAWFGVTVANAGDIELLGKDADGNFFSDMTLDWNELPEEKQKVMTALYDYWKLHYEAGTPLFDPEAGWGYIDESFKSGNGGVIRLGGPWETGGNVELTNDGADLEIVPITQMTIAGHPFLHWKGGWGLGINSRCEENADQMELGVAMIKEIVNPEFAEDLFKSTGKILENVSKEDYLATGLSDVDKDVIVAVLESYEAAPYRPLFIEWGQVWDTWKNAILSWNSVQPADAEAAYNELKASFDAMMQNIG